MLGFSSLSLCISTSASEHLFSCFCIKVCRLWPFGVFLRHFRVFSSFFGWIYSFVLVDRYPLLVLFLLTLLKGSLFVHLHLGCSSFSVARVFIYMHSLA